MLPSITKKNGLRIAMILCCYCLLYPGIGIQRSFAQCCINGTNLLANYNPDFSAAIPAGGMPPGFRTDNLYNNNQAGAGYYLITPSRNYGACGATPQYDHTTGTSGGRFLWFDTPGWATAANPAIAWMPYDPSRPAGTESLIDVTPHTNYVFAVWIRDIARNTDCVSGGAPLMGLRINGVDMAQIDLGTYTTPCCPAWIYLCTSWNSGDSTTARIRIESRRGTGFTDLGIDDVYFGTTTSPSVAGSLGNDTTICQGDVLVLHSPFPNATNQWSDGSTGATLSVTAPGTYWLEVSQSGCTGRDTIVVAQGAPPAAFSLGNDTVFCNGSGSVILSPLPAPAGAYRWQDNSSGTSYTASAAGKYWLEVGNGCGKVSDTLNIGITTSPAPFSLGRDTFICIGTPLVLKPRPTPLAGSLLWQDNSSNATFTVHTAGTYWLTISNACGTVTDTIVVTEQLPPAISLGNDTIVCGYPYIIQSTVSGPGTYLWSTGATTSSIAVRQGGNYSVRYTNICGNAADSINVLLAAYPVLPFGNGVIDTCEQAAVRLDAQNWGMRYLWSTGATSSFITVNTPGRYVVTIYSDNNCSITDTVHVVQHYCKECTLFMPTAFTPNGDGQNDFLRPVSNCALAMQEMLIFNRWGTLLFETKNPQEGWDGSFKSVQQPLGVYFYRIQYIFPGDEKVYTKAGDITLVR